MANITNNRINTHISAADETAINSGFAQIKAKLNNYSQALTEEERKRMRSVDVENNDFSNKALEQGLLLLDKLPASLQAQVNNFKTDTDFYKQLDTIEKTMLMPLLQQIKDTKRLVAHERMVSAEALYKIFAAMAELGVEGFQPAHDLLKSRFEDRKKNKIKSNF